MRMKPEPRGTRPTISADLGDDCIKKLDEVVSKIREMDWQERSNLGVKPYGVVTRSFVLRAAIKSFHFVTCEMKPKAGKAGKVGAK